MASLNRVCIIGYLGRDPQMQYTKNGMAVCRLSVATDESFTNKMGEKVEKTEWHRITTFGKQAENCHAYLAKGSLVYVEGRLETQKWQDREGNDRFTTEINATSVIFLERAHNNHARRTLGMSSLEQHSPKIEEQQQQQQPQQGQEISDFDYAFGSIFDETSDKAKGGVSIMDNAPFL